MCDCEWLIKKFMENKVRKVRSGVSSVGTFYLEFAKSFANSLNMSMNQLYPIRNWVPLFESTLLLRLWISNIHLLMIRRFQGDLYDER